MTELEFYKFFEDIEKDWRGDEFIVWVPFDKLSAFAKLYGPTLSDDGGIDVKLQEKCVAFDLEPIAEYFGLDIEVIFPKEK